jgi:hypothetical protein
MTTGTHFWSAPDTTPRSRADEVADIVEALDPTDALAMAIEDAPAVVAELKRRGCDVRHHVEGQRSMVYVERTAA